MQRDVIFPLAAARRGPKHGFIQSWGFQALSTERLSGAEDIGKRMIEVVDMKSQLIRTEVMTAGVYSDLEVFLGLNNC